MKLDTETIGGASLVTVRAARIDAAVALDFRDRMREIAADAGRRLILDMTAVEFLDSSGLGAIVAAMKEMEEGSRLELAGLGPTVAKVFRLTRMDSVFTIHATRAAALTGAA